MNGLTLDPAPDYYLYTIPVHVWNNNDHTSEA